MHLIGYFSDMPDMELFIVSDERFKVDFDARQDAEQSTWGNNVHFVPIPSIEVQRIHKQSIFRRSFTEWNLMLAYASTCQATHALLMYADYFQLGAWLGKRSKIPVSGIYFRGTLGALGLRNWVKKYMISRVVHSGQIKHLFTLVPEQYKALVQLKGLSTPHLICDPIQEQTVSKKITDTLSNTYPFPAEKTVYLNFGHLDGRKGIELFFEACHLLSEVELASICLVLAGPIQASYQAKIEAYMAKLPALEVIQLYAYIKYPLLQFVFEKADVVLVTYQNHIGMSSVLVRAAHAKKMIIGTNEVMIGQLIRDMRIGITVHTTNTHSMLSAIQQTINKAHEINFEGLRQLKEENSVEAFGRTIQQAICL